jgi:hypothetical protein
MIGDIVSGVGEGQIAQSGTLARVTALPITTEYAALINRPKDIDPLALRPRHVRDGNGLCIQFGTARYDRLAAP